jgi:lipopolysaccharide/colanic/teichoic acid biosynthesis glycosyltransferase
MQPSVLERKQNALFLERVAQSLNASAPLLDEEREHYYRAYDFPKTHPGQWLLKRALDTFAALMALAVFFPLFLLIGLAIRLDSPGPILFYQERVGLRGKPFRMLKFRSMVLNAEQRLSELSSTEGSGKMFKLKQDPRITRVGKFLRKFSLDELPQLINVLRGEMSLVGPRPPLPREVQAYQPWHHVRLATLPGMTGVWQVFGRSDILDFDQVVALDQQYLKNFSFVNDLILIAQTIPAVISTKGSY